MRNCHALFDPPLNCLVAGRSRDLLPRDCRIPVCRVDSVRWQGSTGVSKRSNGILPDPWRSPLVRTIVRRPVFSTPNDPSLKSLRLRFRCPLLKFANDFSVPNQSHPTAAFTQNKHSLPRLQGLRPHRALRRRHLVSELVMHLNRITNSHTPQLPADDPPK
jgi:hypothetical protein